MHSILRDFDDGLPYVLLTFQILIRLRKLLESENLVDNRVHLGGPDEAVHVFESEVIRSMIFPVSLCGIPHCVREPMRMPRMTMARLITVTGRSLTSAIYQKTSKSVLLVVRDIYLRQQPPQ